MRIALVTLVTAAAAVIAVVVASDVLTGRAIGPTVSPAGPHVSEPTDPNAFLTDPGTRDELCADQVQQRLRSSVSLLPDDQVLPQTIFKTATNDFWMNLYVGDRVVVPCMQERSKPISACCTYGMDDPTPGALWLPNALDFKAMGQNDRPSWVFGRVPAGSTRVDVSFLGGPTRSGDWSATIQDGYFFAIDVTGTRLIENPTKIRITAYTSDRVLTKVGPNGRVTSTPS